MTRRALLGLGLASILAIGLVPAVAADTFGSLTGDQVTAQAQFSRWSGGVRQDWDVFAVRDRLAGTTTVGVSYSSEKSITCRDGTDGSIFRFFEGGGSGSFFVGRSLAAATGAVKAHGDEGWFNTCTEGSGSVGKAYLVAFAIGATSRLTTETMTQDILWEDGVCYLLTQHFASREAHGGVLVNGHPFGTSSATIGHTDWDSVPQAASACDEE